MVRKGNKWQSRRWISALLGVFLIIADKIYCVEKGLDIEWFKLFSNSIVLLLLFGAGFITATNMMHMWRNRINNNENK